MIGSMPLSRRLIRVLGMTLALMMLSSAMFPVGAMRAQDANAPITIDGSSILQPLVKAAADAYLPKANNPALKIDVQVSGTDGGFDKFCNATLDVNMATKGITDAQAGQCASKNVQFVEILLGYDAAVVAINRDTKPTCIATDEIGRLFGTNGNTLTTWALVNSTYGEEPIGKFYLNNDARAKNLFTTLVPGGNFRTDSEIIKEGASALMDRINAEKAAITIATYREVQEASGIGKAVKALEIKVNGVCTPANPVNFEAERYPAAQPLYLYVNAAALDRVTVKGFLEYLLNEGKTTVTDKGFILSNDTAYLRNKTYIANKQAGRTFSRIQAVNVSAETTGTISIAGSPETQPILKAVADAFQPRYSKITVTNTPYGADAGVKKLCSNTLDILGTARPLTETELAACKTANVNTVSFTLGAEGVVVLVNTKNTFAECLTLEQLGKLFAADSFEKVKKWSDVDAKFPATDLLLVTPPDGDLSTDLMMRKVVKGIASFRRRDTVDNNDPLYRAAGVGNVEGGVTYMSYADFKKWKDTTAKPIKIDGGKGCVEATDATLADGSYTLSQKYTLLLNQAAFSRPEVKAFVWYLLSEDGIAILTDKANLVGLDRLGFVSGRDTVLELFNKAPTPVPTVGAGTPAGPTPIPTVDLGLNVGGNAGTPIPTAAPTLAPTLAPTATPTP